MSYGSEWHKRLEEASTVVRSNTYTCESHDCQHPEREIVVGLDKRGAVQTYSEEGLVGTMTGWRHRDCPDPRLRDGNAERFHELMGFVLGPRPE